jgi:Flp pilus assembly protein TadG
LRSDSSMMAIASSCARRLGRQDGGNMLLEFALVLPVLAVMLIGMADLGRFALDKSSMLQAARAGAQYGVSASQASITPASALSSGDLSNVDATAVASTTLTGVTVSHALFCECTSGVTVACSSSCSAGGTLKNYLTVTTTRNFSSVMSRGGVTFSFGSWTAPTQVSASVTTILP